MLLGFRIFLSNMLFQNLDNFKKNIAIFDNKKKIYYNDLINEVKELEKKLNKAIENEDYELASKIRDEINKRS